MILIDIREFPDNKSEVFIKGTAPESLCSKDEKDKNRRR